MGGNITWCDTKYKIFCLRGGAVAYGQRNHCNSLSLSGGVQEKNKRFHLQQIGTTTNYLCLFVDGKFVVVDVYNNDNNSSFIDMLTTLNDNKNKKEKQNKLNSSRKRKENNNQEKCSLFVFYKVSNYSNKMGLIEFIKLMKIKEGRGLASNTANTLHTVLHCSM